MPARARARTPHGQFFMLRGAPRCMGGCEEEGPEPVRRHGILALPKFLTVA